MSDGAEELRKLLESKHPDSTEDRRRQTAATYAKLEREWKLLHRVAPTVLRVFGQAAEVFEAKGYRAQLQDDSVQLGPKHQPSISLRVRPMELRVIVDAFSDGVMLYLGRTDSRDQQLYRIPVGDLSERALWDLVQRLAKNLD